MTERRDKEKKLLTAEEAIRLEEQAYKKYSTMNKTKAKRSSSYVDNFQPLNWRESKSNGSY